MFVSRENLISFAKLKIYFCLIPYAQHEMSLHSFFLFDPQLLIFVFRIGTGDPVCATELSAAVVRAEVPGPGPAQGPH
jgi:hypothetical protein